MDIHIDQEPPKEIPRLRWRYTVASLVFLGLVICSISVGVYSVLSATADTGIFENIAFGLFVAAGLGFVYFTEKLLGFRRPGPKLQEKLAAMVHGHADVAEYCRKVAEQGRYPVVLEYEAIVEHVRKTEEAQKI